MATTWTIDPVHSSVTFSVRHMMISNVRGEFQKLSGTVSYDGGVQGASVSTSIDVGTLFTRESDRDAHLKSPDFLDAAKYPTITFASKSVEAHGSGRLKITGDLTIHGTTRPVTLDVEGPTAPAHDPWGNTRMGASATTKIKRSEFGMTWNKAIEAGGLLVGDEISVNIDVSLVKKTS